MTVTTPAVGLKPLSLSHSAWQTTDMQKTHEFWTEVLGLDYIGALRYNHGFAVSSGDVAPDFIHTFYAMADGSCVAFFELGNTPQKKDDGWPGWTRHLALNVSSRDELREWEKHLTAHGVEYDGEIVHQNGMFYSIYVTDPNGIRVELTYMPQPLGADAAREAVEILKQWNADRAAGTLQ